MLANFNMNRKLQFTLLPTTLIITAIILIFTLQAVKTSVSDTAMQTSKQLVVADGKEVVENLVKNYNRLTAVAEALVIRKDLNIYEGRIVINNLLKALLESEPNVLGIWTGWEPNAFDRLDAKFIDSEGSDSTGRFLPYFYRDKNQISLTNIEFYEDPVKGEYYQLAKKLGKAVVLNPFIYPINGKDTLMTTISIPLFEDNKFVGVVGMDFQVDKFQQNVARLNRGQIVSALFSQDGTIIAHPDASRLGKNLADTEGDLMGSRLTEAVAAVTQGRAYATSFFTPAINAEALVVYEPVRLGDLDTYWSMARLIPIKDVLADVDSIIQQVVIIGAVGILILIIVLSFLARNLAAPLSAAAAALEDVAQGEGDLTQRLEVKGKDELARLSQAFNTFAEKIQFLVSKLATHSQTLAATSSQLSSSSELAAQGAEQQQQEITQVVNAMEDLTTTVYEVAHNVEKTSQATLVARQQTQQSSLLIEDIARTISGQAAEVENTAKHLAELEGASNEIGEVVTTIQDVAEQTNLLALNAAIEAARAGEHGRGFAVVADEVRSLASRTHTSTEEISATIEKLQERIHQAVAAMGKSQSLSEESVEKAKAGLAALETITQQVEQIEEMNNLVASTTEQQSETSSELATNTLRLSELANQASQGAQDTAKGSRAMEKLARQLHKLVSSFKY